MGTKELVAVLLSSTVVATLITTLFNILTNKRKNEIENITKERKIWREELRKIAEEISKARNNNQLELAITKLKVRINAYGVADNSIFYDSHFWTQFFNYENHDKQLIKCGSKKILNKNKSFFINQISCILKYDWERAKSEIKGNMQNKFVVGTLIISFLFYSLRYFLKNGFANQSLIEFITFAFVFLLFAIYALLVITWADKWVSKFQWHGYLFLSIIGFIYVIFILWDLFPKLIFTEIIDAYILVFPMLALLYSSEVKIINYKRNTSRFILSSTILSGSNKIDKKYKVFFYKKPYFNIVTNREITFE